MILNYIWIFFFVSAFAVALYKLVAEGDTSIFGTMVNGAFDSAKGAFELSLGLTGVLSLWLGIMKIGEKAGVIALFSKLIAPLFNKLFPSLPKNNAVFGTIVMNLSANMLGLDNAATPLGLKAMKEMQTLNNDQSKASDAMIMFLVLNTSGLTLIPVSIMVYRAQLGATNPADVFLPILIATYFSTIVGVVAVCLQQRIRLLNATILSWFAGLTLLIGAIIWYFLSIDRGEISGQSSFVSNFILLTIITGFVAGGFYKRINVYDSFIEGAKEGFGVAVTIIPYLIAILVAVALFRASGAMDFLIGGIKWLLDLFAVRSDFADALPTALMKPLSGSGARGMMVDAMKVHGADSLVGRMVSVVQGATDTTFYILAVYFGSVNIRNTRYALSCGLAADLAGIVAAIVVSYLFFG